LLHANRTARAPARPSPAIFPVALKFIFVSFLSSVGTLYAYVSKFTPGVSFTLVGGVPPRPLTDNSATLASAGLLNAMVRQTKSWHGVFGVPTALSAAPSSASTLLLLMRVAMCHCEKFLNASHICLLICNLFVVRDDVMFGAGGRSIALREPSAAASGPDTAQ
jgi:hypothetical protein